MEYAIRRLMRFWYRAATEAKQIDPRPEITNKKYRTSKFPEKTTKSVFIKKLSNMIFGIVEKKAVIFIIDPS